MLVFGILLCITAFFVQAAVAADTQWSYYGVYGVANWSLIYPLCSPQNNNRPSPINIVQMNAQYDMTLTPISFTMNQVPNDAVILVNNGHTASFSYNQSIIRISGGNFIGTYRVASVHFHWGSNDSIGSEQTIDGQQFPIEMHFVAYDDSRFKNLSDATYGNNSVVALSTLFTISTADNLAFSPLINLLKNVTTNGSTVALPYFNLTTLLPTNTARYFQYMGSFAYPPCSPNIVWAIFNTTQTISPAQISEFRKLQWMTETSGAIDSLSNNWRPVQPIDGRTVLSSFPTSNASTMTSVPTTTPSVAVTTSSDAVKVSSLARLTGVTALALVVFKVIATEAA